MVKHLALALALVGASCSSSPPSSFGVNLTIVIAPAVRDRVARVDIHVGGAETFDTQIPGSSFSDGTARVQYVPGVRSGTLTFEAMGISGSGALVAGGNSGPITLIDGAAAPAAITIDACPARPCPANSVCDPATGVCLAGKQLGEACGLSTDCLSKLCLDGVCCAQDCPACMNCGATGQCDVVVAGMDDLSSLGCTGDSSCNASGQCKMRWTQVSVLSSTIFDSWGHTVGAGDHIYLAAANGCNTGFFKSLDVTTQTVIDLPTTMVTMDQSGMPITVAPIDACGYSGYLFGGALAGVEAVGFVGNYAAAYGYPNANAWSALPYPASNRRGEAGIALYGTGFYMIGGRESGGDSKSVFYYDLLMGTWTTAPDAPFEGNSWCAGSLGTNVYILGGRFSDGRKMFKFDTSNNNWGSLPDIPTSCDQKFLPTWRDQLVVPGDNGLYLWDEAGGWKPRINYPTVGGSAPWHLAVTGQVSNPSTQGLYVATDVGLNIVIYKYEL